MGQFFNWVYFVYIPAYPQKWLKSSSRSSTEDIGSECFPMVLIICSIFSIVSRELILKTSLSVWCQIFQGQPHFLFPPGVSKNSSVFRPKKQVNAATELATLLLE